MATQPFTGINQHPLVFAQIRNGSSSVEENPAKVCYAPDKLKISEGDFLKLFYMGNGNPYCHEYDQNRKFQVIDCNEYGKNIVQAATKYSTSRLLVEDIMTLSGKVWKFKPTVRVADFFANSLGIPIDCWTPCSRMQISRELENSDVLKYDLKSCDEDKEVCAMTAGELHKALNGFPSTSDNDKEVELSIIFENDNPDIQSLDLRLRFVLTKGLCPISNDPYCGYTYDPVSGKCFMWCYSATKDNAKEMPDKILPPPPKSNMFVVMNNGTLDYVKSNINFKVTRMTKDFPSSRITLTYDNCSVEYKISKLKNNQAGYRFNNNTYVPLKNNLLRYSESGIVTEDFRPCRITILYGGESCKPYRLNYEKPIKNEGFVVMNNGMLDHIESPFTVSAVGVTRDLPPSIIRVSYGNCSVNYTISKLKNGTPGFYYQNNTYVPVENRKLRYSESGIVTLDISVCRVTITGGGNSTQPYRISYEKADILKQ